MSNRMTWKEVMVVETVVQSRVPMAQNQVGELTYYQDFFEAQRILTWRSKASFTNRKERSFS